jgi:hypothetical protein
METPNSKGCLGSSKALFTFIFYLLKLSTGEVVLLRGILKVSWDDPVAHNSIHKHIKNF